MRPVLPCVLFALTACGEPYKDKKDAMWDDTGDSAGDSDRDTHDSADPADSAETGDSADEGLPPVVVSCSVPYAYTDGEGGTGAKALAQDLTLPTLRGDWTLSERWTGCDSYLFLIYRPDESYAEKLWSSDVADFLERAPEDVQVFFLSDSPDAATDVATMKASVDAALAELDDETSAAWDARFHYVATPLSELEGWLPEVAADWGTYHFAIDRFQRLRPLGMLYNASRAQPKLHYLANEAIYYQFEAERDQALSADGATVITAWTDEPMSDTGWAGVSSYADIELPDAEAMAGFDTMSFDLSMDCADHLDTSCPAWDYLVALYLCDADDPDTCDTEIGRWVTTYAREGRWVMDVSPYLALLQDGGSRRLRFYTTQAYLVSLDIRLSNQGSGLVPFEAQYLFSGGSFNERYNDAYSPITFTVPEDAQRVELVATISGHGWGDDTENCAEFCDHTHHFVVNGSEYVKEHEEAGTIDGCEQQVDEGTVPNQYGTWNYGRGGWCPGREVAPWVVDITSAVTLGGENTIEYYGLLRDETYVPEYTDEAGFWANINMTSYVVFWR